MNNPADHGGVRGVASGGFAVRVRPPGREDMPRLWEMLQGLAEYERLLQHVSGSQAQLEELLFGGHDHLDCRVAERDGRLVGYAIFYITYSTFRTGRGMWLEDLYVDPAERGSGAGRLLLADVARAALAQNCHGIAWYVLDWNEPAIGFYKAIGAAEPVSDWVQYSLDPAAVRRLAEGG